MNKNETKPGRDSKGRYKKGHTPNPKGRPKKVPQKLGPSFDVIFDRKIPVTAADGSRRELTTAQALQHATLKAALDGKASAINQVVKWLVKRDAWIRKEAEQKAARVKKHETDPYSSLKMFKDPENANMALQLLGIAVHDANYDPSSPDVLRLQLEHWAVEMALSRRRNSEPLSDSDILSINVSTRDEESLSWPEGSRS